MATRKINIQVLVDFADKRKRVDPWELKDAAESFYNSIKVVGINNTVVTYKNGTEKIEDTGNHTSIYVRAFAAHIVRLLNRWNDMNSGRLEAHYQLEMPILVILADTGVFKTNGADLACTNVSEMIDTWATN